MATTSSPRAKQSHAESTPARGAVSSTTTGAGWSGAPRSSAEASPPCARTSARNFSAAWPPSSACVTFLSAAAVSGAAPESRTISAASASVSDLVPAIFSPRSARHASRTSSAFPTALPIGQLMSVTRAEAAAPSERVVATRREANPRAASRVFMNAPFPHLTS